jgi:hypothetical protein
MAGGHAPAIFLGDFDQRILTKVLAVSRAMSLAILPSFNEDAAKLRHERTVKRSPMFRDRKGLKRMQRTAGKQSQVSLTQVQTFVFQAIAVSSSF